MDDSIKGFFNIAVVDDNKSVCNSLRRELKVLGKRNDFILKVDTFQDPIIGFKHICEPKNNVHLVISDLKMPYLTGDVLVARIKEKLPDMPIIVITGYATKESVISILKSDKNCTILSKPWDYKKLASEIGRHLNIELSVDGKEDDS